MGDQQKISAKGTTKHAQKNLQHSVFYRILEKETLLRTLNYTINSERHNLFTLQTTSCFDDKRYIFPNGVDTLHFGHYFLRHDVIFREIGGLRMGERGGGLYSVTDTVKLQPTSFIFPTRPWTQSRCNRRK